MGGGALMAREHAGKYRGLPVAKEKVEIKEIGLPDTCERLPDELRGVLDLIS